MRFRMMVSLATMFAMCLTIALWSQPLPANGLSPKARVPEGESISGKISSVGDASFSIDVIRDQELDTLQFLVDGSTKVDGKLLIGAEATVQYRTEEGKNVATRVVVRRVTNMELY